MITVKVTYKNIIDFVIGNLITRKLLLNRFPCVDQNIPVLYFKKLCGRKAPEGRERAAGTKDCYFKGQVQCCILVQLAISDW